MSYNKIIKRWISHTISVMRSLIINGVSMLFFRKRNPLMRQRFKNSNNISVQDIINTINTFNDKLDQLNSTMSEVRDLLAGGVSYTTSNNDTGTKRSSNKD